MHVWTWTLSSCVLQHYSAAVVLWSDLWYYLWHLCWGEHHLQLMVAICTNQTTWLVLLLDRSSLESSLSKVIWHLYKMLTCKPRAIVQFWTSNINFRYLVTVFVYKCPWMWSVQVHVIKWQHKYSLVGWAHWGIHFQPPIQPIMNALIVITNRQGWTMPSVLTKMNNGLSFTLWLAMPG